MTPSSTTAPPPGQEQTAPKRLPEGYDMTENVYEKARQVLKERGWAKGTFGFDSVCLVGACNVALGEGASETLPAAFADPLNAVIREQFPEFEPTDYSDISDAMWFAVDWNDNAASSVADVDLVLDKAARQWDETHGGAA